MPICPKSNTPMMTVTFISRCHTARVRRTRMREEHTVPSASQTVQQSASAFVHTIMVQHGAAKKIDIHLDMNVKSEQGTSARAFRLMVTAKMWRSMLIRAIM